MKAFEIISLILNFILASGLLGTLLFFNSKKRTAKAEADSADLQNTDKIIQIQTAHIGRLDQRVEKLEEKVDKLEVIIEDKDSEINRQRYIIRQAHKCQTPAEQCPVLIKRAELDKQLKDKKDEQRITKP
ncbi:hypothetical protein KML24007_03900 [Alistipes indistinctus]|uniref:hypothetical protein n=1 Tax=Alistipes indistinctus TaxID=626932 RepID=UPI0036F40401